MKKDYFQHEQALVSPQAQIGAGTRIWAFANIQAGAVIGEHCNICDGCFIEKGTRIGHQVTLKNGVNIFEGMVIEDKVFCGSNATFINDRYPRSDKKDWVMERTLLKKGATVGSNATILCGITIGEYAFVAAGSVVTKDVPAYHLVAGNPARFHGYACRCGRKIGDDLRCGCGRSYSLSGQTIVPQE